MNDELLPPKHLITPKTPMFWSSAIHAKSPSFPFDSPQILPRSQVSVTESCAPVNAFAASLVNTAWPTSSSSGCLEPAPKRWPGTRGRRKTGPMKWIPKIHMPHIYIYIYIILYYVYILYYIIYILYYIYYIIYMLYVCVYILYIYIYTYIYYSHESSWTTYQLERN